MDPTYPLVPIANLLSAFLVLLALLSNGVRQSWNTGVTMFGFWIFVVAVCIGVNTIVWSDNTNNSAPVWCDISSHLEVASNVGIPASSLVITHRLYKIIQRQAVEPRTKHMKYIELLFDLFLGLGLPILVTGFYYVVQGARFLILEEFGCSDAYDVSGLEVLIIDGWGIVLPIISIAFYCCEILWHFYRHSRQTNAFLRTNASVNRAKYIRVFAIGCIDILLTLPIGFLIFATDIQNTVAGDIGFWPGWSSIHEDWDEPVPIPAAEWRSTRLSAFGTIWGEYINVVFALLFFALFGLTGDARAFYYHAFWTTAERCGWRRSMKQDLPAIAFGSNINTRDIGRVSPLPDVRCSLVLTFNTTGRGCHMSCLCTLM
ncbi:pheromone A receptor-domain-containing protein [Amylostereum chailletii]|nr:pheromone A receptor-domain-containing protein [Amylostereum chailletii]